LLYFAVSSNRRFFEVASESNMDEKQIHKSCLDHSTEDQADVIPTSLENGIQLTGDEAVDKHGTRLHPQPTSDPLDPLNWSTFQKHGILSIVMLKSDLSNR
jgi:hypothetical protein